MTSLQWEDSGDEDSVLIEEGGASQCSTACPDDTCTVASLNWLYEVFVLACSLE